MEVGWDEVAARRLARSSLSDRTSGDRLVEVVSTVCGVHAQVQASAELQLAARVEGIEQAGVRAALWEQRSLVKAWTIRGTLHLHPAEELSLWYAARRAVAGEADRGLPSWRDPAGAVHPVLEAEEVEAIRAVVWEVLDGRCLLREELAKEVVKRVGAAPRERLRSGFAFFLGELCQGPPQGSRITLVRPDQWIDGWRGVDDDAEALREVCRRFLRAYGPATRTELAAWAGISPTHARALLAEIEDEVEGVDLAGRQALILAADSDRLASPPAASGVRLLGGYDAYLDQRDRETLLPDRDLRKRVRRPLGNPGVVLVDGQLAGLWRPEKKGKRLVVNIEPITPAARRAADGAEAEASVVAAHRGCETAEIAWV